MYLEISHCAFFDISYGGILVLAIEDAQEMFQLRTVCVHVYECWGCGPSQHVFTICQIWAPFDPGEMIEKGMVKGMVLKPELKAIGDILCSMWFLFCHTKFGLVRCIRSC